MIGAPLSDHRPGSVPARPIRVLYVNPIGALGGAEQSLLDLLASLDPKRVAARLLSFSDGPLIEGARSLGISCAVVELGSELSSLGESGLSPVAGLLAVPKVLRAAPRMTRFVASFRNEIENFGPDLLHTNGVKSHWVSAVFSPARLPLVIHVRDYLSERRISKHLLRLLERRAGAVIANSQSVAQDVRSIAERIPIHPIHNAIDLVRFSPGAGDPTWLASLAGMSAPREGEVCVALVATYARWKGQDLAIRALARLLSGGTSCRLYIVGGPIYATRKSQFDTEELRALAREHGVEKSVGFVPFQVDTPRVYRSVDAVLQTSTRREAFGRTIVEAMACGKAVVISRAGGAVELFEDGETALGFDPDDSSSLASTLDRIVLSSDLRRRIGESARRRALEGFDRARLGGAVEKVYREVLQLP